MQVSMIIPVHNGEHTLEACVRSIRAQTGISFEIIIADAASTDGTAALAASMAARTDGVKLIRLQTDSLAAACDAAVARSEGKFLRLLDTACQLPPSSTSVLLARARAEGSDLTAGACAELRGKRRKLFRPQKQALRLRCGLCSLLLRRETVEQQQLRFADYPSADAFVAAFIAGGAAVSLTDHPVCETVRPTFRLFSALRRHADINP